MRVYSPSPAADAEDEDGVRIYCPGSGAKSFAASADTDAEEIEFDPRFNLGGKKKDTELSFNGKSVDLSADYDYAPPLPHDADFVSAYAELPTLRRSRRMKRRADFSADSWISSIRLRWASQRAKAPPPHGRRICRCRDGIRPFGGSV